MKNRFLQFSIAILVVLFFGCSTSSDGNGNSNTTIVPIVPTNFTGELVNNQVVLSWNDSSTNETGFKIDRKEGTAAWSVNYATVAADIETYTDASVTAGSTYTYRVYSYNSVGPSLVYSSTITLTIPVAIILPLISNESVSVTSNSASTGGTITSDGGAPITARGVVWSNSPGPTVALPTKTTDGIGIGSFTSTITGLTPNSNYNLRVYATNSLGTAYGTEISITTSQDFTAINVPGPNVTDIEGNIYNSVTNCGLTFTNTNLNVTKYSDGTPIPQVTDPNTWANLTTGAWCYIVNETLYGTTFGKLYNWYAVAGIYNAASAGNPAIRKKLAPTGWHVPSDGEWNSLINCLDPNADGGNFFPNAAGGKMKSTGSIQTQSGLWQSPNTDATNASGFEGRPGGGRDIYGAFTAIYNTGGWWSSSELNASDAWYRDLYYSNGYVSRLSFGKRYGFSVRCIKD